MSLQEPWYFSFRRNWVEIRRVSHRHRGAPLRLTIVAIAAVLATGWVWQTYAPMVPVSWFNLFMVLPALAAMFTLQIAMVCVCPRYLKLNKRGATIIHGQSATPLLARWITRIRVRPTRLGHWVIIRYEHPKHGTRWKRFAISAKASRSRLDAAIAQVLAQRDAEIAKQAENAARKVGRGWFATAR